CVLDVARRIRGKARRGEASRPNTGGGGDTVCSQAEARTAMPMARGQTGRVAFVVALMLLVAGAARAHNIAADLSVWGGFGGETAGCQRVISRAAALCAGRVLVARAGCASEQLRGVECDQAALDARIQAA